MLFKYRKYSRDIDARFNPLGVTLISNIRRIALSRRGNSVFLCIFWSFQWSLGRIPSFGDNCLVKGCVYKCTSRKHAIYANQMKGKCHTFLVSFKAYYKYHLPCALKSRTGMHRKRTHTCVPQRILACTATRKISLNAPRYQELSSLTDQLSTFENGDCWAHL